MATKKMRKIKITLTVEQVEEGKFLGTATYNDDQATAAGKTQSAVLRKLGIAALQLYAASRLGSDSES